MRFFFKNITDFTLIIWHFKIGVFSLRITAIVQYYTINNEKIKEFYGNLNVTKYITSKSLWIY